MSKLKVYRGGGTYRSDRIIGGGDISLVGSDIASTFYNIERRVRERVREGINIENILIGDSARHPIITDWQAVEEVIKTTLVEYQKGFPSSYSVIEERLGIDIATNLILNKLKIEAEILNSNGLTIPQEQTYMYAEERREILRKNEEQFEKDQLKAQRRAEQRAHQIANLAARKRWYDRKGSITIEKELTKDAMFPPYQVVECISYEKYPEYDGIAYQVMFEDKEKLAGFITNLKRTKCADPEERIASRMAVSEKAAKQIWEEAYELIFGDSQ